MIHKFSFKNFYSFKDEAVINFEVNNRAPKTDAYFQDKLKNNLTKVLTVMGPNASGKTNLLKVLPFLQFFIINSFQQNPDDKIPVKQFLFDENIEPSKFSVEFEIESKIYDYELIVSTDKVIKEALKVKDIGRFSTLFKREWNEKTQKYSSSLKSYGLPSNFVGLLRKNVSVISTGNQVSHPLSVAIVEYWKKMQTNVVEAGRIYQPFLDAELFKVSEYFYKNPELKEKAQNLLLKFDLGLSGIDIKEQKNPNKDESELFYLPVGIHKNLIDDKSPKTLQFIYESSGTRNLFLILFKVLSALESGSMVVFDEFDSDLHPSMIPELVNLFVSPVFNKKNAQLFFSTHHPQIINSLDKYQVVLVEKDENGYSESWRLDEIDGVRSDDNYYAKYMSGAYGGVPRL